MPDLLTHLRAACAAVAARAEHVRVIPEAIPAYAARLPSGSPAQPEATSGSREHQIAYWLTLDAINFGSGWFPTLRKRAGRSGYFTIAMGLHDRFASNGPWSAAELRQITAATLAQTLGQDPGHELMELFARSLRDLGEHVDQAYGGSFGALVDGAGGSAAGLADLLSGWPCFEDRSAYGDLELHFLKRAQIAAADIHRAGLAKFSDLDRLTMFADNLVPHVLRLDGVLEFQPELVEKIQREELLEHGSAEEVEIRACALHAVELLVAACPGSCAAVIDEVLWRRGQEPRYKASPRHRCRCTAY
jgi:hypothetical protein